MRNNGKRFENNFKSSAIKQGLFYERFKDNGKFGFSDKTRFSSNNPSDAFIFDGKALYYVELKSTVGTSISFNHPCAEKGNSSKMIKAHQINSLLERSKYPNVYSLLILDFADRVTKAGKLITGGTYAIKIQDFVEWASNTYKSSINLDDCKQIGIEVSRKLKKVNYDYNVVDMINNLTQCK